jgi:hypothetical protein
MKFMEVVLAAISALAGVGAIVAAFWVYVRQRRRKELAYQIVSLSRLLQPETARIKRLQLTYDGSLVSDAYLFLIRLTNTGNEPIVRDDYETPILVCFSPSPIVLDVELIASSHPNMIAQLERRDGQVAVHGLLLNPGDYVALQILLDGQPDQWTVEGRIAGVTEIKAL